MLADKAENRHTVSRRMPIYAFMHLVVRGAFWPAASPGLERQNGGLNAPSGAGCFLTVRRACLACRWTSLNAPSGAGCFLTFSASASRQEVLGLNAPCGAGCFLTHQRAVVGCGCGVLMHLLVLGAF